MKTHVAIVGVVKYKNKILILKRSRRKKYSPGLWEFVGGFLHEGEATEDCALREVKEEIGLSGELKLRGKPFEYEDKYSRWVVVPHLVMVQSDKVKLSREHTEYSWILPEELECYDHVINAGKDLKSLGLI